MGTNRLLLARYSFFKIYQKTTFSKSMKHCLANLSQEAESSLYIHLSLSGPCHERSVITQPPVQPSVHHEFEEYRELVRCWAQPRWRARARLHVSSAPGNLSRIAPKRDPPNRSEYTENTVSFDPKKSETTMYLDYSRSPFPKKMIAFWVRWVFD